MSGDLNKTLPKWLKQNLGTKCLAGLTTIDAVALKAAVHMIELWLYSYGRVRPEIEAGFGAVVRCMQPKLRYLAYHAVAHVGNWEDREKLWGLAGLEPLSNAGLCNYEPGGKLRFSGSVPSRGAVEA